MTAAIGETTKQGAAGAARRRFFLVFNPTAGRSRAAAVARLVAALESDGAVVTRSSSTSAETARAEVATAARSGQYDGLIACGGDGTVRQVAAAAAGTACPVGAFMLGTGNVLAHELVLPRDARAFADLLRHGAARDIRLGLANGEPFLLMAGIGFDGRTIANLDHGIKQKIAKAAFLPATLKALAAPLDRLAVEIDGVRHDGVTSAIVTSASRYGGAFQLTSRTSITSDGLIAILFRARGKIEVVRQSMALMRGRLDGLAERANSGITMQACRSVVITSADPVPVQIDGDTFGTTPLTLSADGPRVSLIAP